MGRIRRYRLGISDIVISIKNILGTVSKHGEERGMGEGTRCSYNYAITVDNLDIIIGIDYISQADGIVN